MTQPSKSRCLAHLVVAARWSWLLGLAGCSLHTPITNGLEDHAALSAALACAQRHGEATAHLGDGVVADRPSWGRARDEVVWMAVPVRGDDGEGQLSLDAQLHDDGWRFRSLVLRSTDGPDILLDRCDTGCVPLAWLPPTPGRHDAEKRESGHVQRVVPVRDLPAGTTVHRDDVKWAFVPGELATSPTVADPRPALCNTLVRDVAQGEPLPSDALTAGGRSDTGGAL